MGKEFYFETDDRLDREKYAEFLKTLLEHCDEYRREDSDGAYVIAIDSPWGTGKTRFAKMLKNKLECRAPKLVSGEYDKTKIITNDRASSFNVIYYNSWETDYWNDALEPLLNTILNTSVFETIRKNAKYKAYWDQFVEFTKGVLEASVDVVAGVSIWGIIAKVLIYGVKKTREKSKDPFAEFKEQEKLYSEFADSLKKVIELTGKKLIIIVDELDRCRPTYAIQTLELVKHLFKVENLAFIFALDIEQLSHAAGTIYGANMDAPGYLCRFFDYIGKIPDANKADFIVFHLQKHAFFLKNKEALHSLSNYINELTKTYLLSLRDVSTILTNYNVMLDTFLAEYEYLQFHRLYLFLLTLKYRNLTLYSDFISNKKLDDDLLIEVRRFVPKSIETEKKVLDRQLSMLSIPSKLSEKEFAIYPNDINMQERESYMPDKFCIEKINKTHLKGGEEVLNISTKIKNPPNNSYPGPDKQLTRGQLLYDVLEFNDIIKWLDIRELTLGQYYYQQLEMFNFALPAEESPPPSVK